MSPFVTFSSPSAPDRPLFPTANEKDSPLMAWERELDRASASSATGTNTRGFATTFTPTSSPVDHYGGLHRVRLAERSGDDVATFMLSSLNGRKQLMEMDMKRRFALQCRPCELCGHPDGEYVCSDCFDAPLCGICTKTDPGRHRQHMEFIKPEKRSHVALSTAPRTSVCNGCGERPLTNVYYRCQVCDDYDLCAHCDEINDTLYTLGRGESIHDFRHPHDQDTQRCALL